MNSADYYRQAMGRNARKRAAKKAAAKAPGRRVVRGTREAGAMSERERSLPYIRSYLTLGEYIGKWLKSKGERYSPSAFIPLLLRQHRRDHLLAELAFLNHTLTRTGLRNRLIGEYRGRVTEEARGDLDRLLNEERVFVGRQAVLRAMRLVLLEGTDSPDGTWGQQSVDTAIWLTQAVAEDLGNAISEKGGPELWPGIQGPLAMELVQNYTFHGQEDIWQRLTRYGALWSSYGEAAGRTSLRASPEELFREATGVERPDLFAIAFGLWSLANNWNPPQSYRFDLINAVRMPKQTTERCLGLIALDMAGMAQALRDQGGDWQMLPFEEHPVLRLDDGSVIVLDESLLLDRVSSGLYWYVLNYEQARDDRLASTWSTAYGAMVESYAEDRIRAMGPSADAFYSEEQIRAAYPGKQADAVLDIGTFVFFEIQKGQVSLPTRQEGVVEKFKGDTERMILGKAAQLEEAAANILDDETPLTGKSQRSAPIGWPVIVSGGGYPVNPITSEYISYTASQRGLLRDPRFQELCVIDLGELEMLEAVCERTGRSVDELLRGWKSGGGQRYSLRTHFLESLTGDPDQYRPAWMLDAGGKVFDDVERRVAFRTGNNQ